MLDSSTERGTIGIVGAGRLGSALAVALRNAGRRIVGPLGRGTTGDGCDVIILCVPDAQIAAAAKVIAVGPIVGHTSGATTLEPLAPHEAFSLHPLLSVVAPETSFTGTSCAIAGTSEHALATARSLTAALGMRAFVVAESDRALYHAAASMASNYITTLEGAAEDLFAKVGVAREHMAPLVLSAVEQWARVGARQSLTGPLARGDEATVALQRAAIANRDPALLPLWDALAEATRTLAGRRV